MNQQESRKQNLLVFTQGNTTFGIYAYCIQEITEVLPITFLPHSGTALRGITNYKGEILPVFSLFGMMHIPVKDTEKICLIIKEEDIGKIAITIERAEGLHNEETVYDIPPADFSIGDLRFDAIIKSEVNICVIDIIRSFQNNKLMFNKKEEKIWKN